MTPTDPRDDPRFDDLRQLADSLASVARRVDAAPGRPLDRLAEATLDAIPGAEAVSLTVLEPGGFRSEAATDELAARADALQYELGLGPCVDAAVESTANRSGDVAADPRWSRWGRRANDEVGVRSVLAHRLVLEGEGQPVASLNAYSTRVDAFDDSDLHRGSVLATHGSLLLAALLARQAAADLTRTLRENREVGVAMGVLMHRHRLTRDQAFDLLRLAGQETNRPLGDVATAVVEHGGLGTLSLRHDPDADPVAEGEPAG